MRKTINTIFRTELNGGGLSYQGDVLPIYFSGDQGYPDGAHIRGLLFTNQFDYKEVGSNLTVTPRDLTGYYQVGLFIPTSDKGIDSALKSFTDDVDTLFRRRSFIVDDVRMQYLDVQSLDEQRVDGYYSVTCLINFTAYQCII